jgi:hypothetical protein
MNRREFLGRIGWSALTAAGMIIAAGSREPVYAGGKKGGGDTGKSGLSGMDLGSGRFKTNSPTQKGKGLIIYDDLSK